MKQIKFLQVDIDIARTVGIKEAYLYALLKTAAKICKKDQHGYFSVETTWIRRQSGLAHASIFKYRDSLKQAGLLDYIPGVNQNAGVRYKFKK